MAVLFANYSIIATIFISIIAGGFSVNYIYVDYLKHKSIAEEKFKTESERIMYIGTTGGTQPLAILAYIAISLVLEYLSYISMTNSIALDTGAVNSILNEFQNIMNEIN